jgi:hypothetical protein
MQPPLANWKSDVLTKVNISTVVSQVTTQCFLERDYPRSA